MKMTMMTVKAIQYLFYLLISSTYSETTLSQQYQTPELVDIESWSLSSDLLHKYECEHFDETDKTHPR